MHHAFKFGDQLVNVELSRSAQDYRLHFQDRQIAVSLEQGADGRAWLSVDGCRRPVVVATHGDDVFVHLDGESYQLRYQHPLDRLAAELGGAGEDRILAPMPGSIVSVAVAAGEAVTTGQTLLVMESMKMETTITAPRDGVIAEVMMEVGQTFDRDAALLSLEPREASE